MIRYKETNKEFCFPTFSTKVKGAIGLYSITKSSGLIQRYIKEGINLYKHFLFDGLYTWRISDYSQIFRSC